MLTFDTTENTQKIYEIADGRGPPFFVPSRRGRKRIIHRDDRGGGRGDVDV
jgi:hypothetical protein